MTTRIAVKALALFLAMKLVISNYYDFTYNGFQGANLSLNGAATIKPNGLLQLTSTTLHQLGRAFNPIPLQFKDPSNGNAFSFTTTFVFAIVPEEPDFGGHGMALAISPSQDFQGGIGSEYLGLFNLTSNGIDSNHVFAVELDTILSPEFEDINNNHVGIDINGLKSNESAPAAYFTSRNGENHSLLLISGEPIQVWVDYDGVTQQVNVTLSPLNIPQEPNWPLLSLAIDLSQVFLDNMYLGFSSATGSMSSSHYLLGWSFAMNGRARPLDLSRLPSVPRRKSRRWVKQFRIWITVAILVLVLTAISAGLVYVMRKKKYAEVLEDWEVGYGPQRFSYKDLYTATEGFKDKELLGEGGFGRVYKGVLPTSKIEVAVKRVSHESKQGLREFVAEIASMSRLRHRNIVQLLGYCRRKGELLLVYDFMPNGSLEKLIFDQIKPVLNWFQRFRILKGVACGLLYLHEEWEQIVVHRDVKAGNVLLDSDLNGRLGDFGLARLYDRGSDPQTTHVVGTLGYLAPELARTGKATTCSDVFAFGALLLEVACGRRPIHRHDSSRKLVLVDWVVDCWQRGAIIESSDPRLGSDFVVVEMELVLKLGLLCSHPVSTARPSMRQVVQFLEGHTALPETLLDFFSSGDSSIMGLGEEFVGFAISSPFSMEKMSVNSFSGSDSHLSEGP